MEAGGTASAKASGQDHVWCVEGVARRPMWLEQSERGRGTGQVSQGLVGSRRWEGLGLLPLGNWESWSEESGT